MTKLKLNERPYCYDIQTCQSKYSAHKVYSELQQAMFMKARQIYMNKMLNCRLTLIVMLVCSLPVLCSPIHKNFLFNRIKASKDVMDFVSPSNSQQTAQSLLHVEHCSRPVHSVCWNKVGLFSKIGDYSITCDY